MKKYQLNLLKICVQESDPQLLQIFPTDELDSILSEEIRKRLINAVTDKLLRQGFDEEWKPTKLGVQLEELINLLLRTDLQ